jgi:drug/metabolite transporter (DMT)-like permease
MGIAGPLGIVYVVWGSTYLALKVGIADLPPLTLNAVRFLIAGAMLWAWCAWRRRAGSRWRRPTAAEWRAGAIQGLLLPAAGTGGATWAEQRLSSGTTALLLATIPVWMVLARRLAFRERIGASVGLGLVAGLVGVGLLVSPFTSGAPDALATTVAIGGAACWGAGSVYAQRAPRPDQPLLASSVEMLCAGAALAVLGGMGGEFGRVHLSAGSVAALGYLIVFGSLLAYSAYEWLLQHAPARIAGTYAFVNPLVAVALGWWLLGEPVGTRTLVAAAVIAAGVALIVLPKPGAQAEIEEGPVPQAQRCS